jgi:hypothetical protein
VSEHRVEEASYWRAAPGPPDLGGSRAFG